MKCLSKWVAAVALVCGPIAAQADTVTIDFEGQPDGGDVGSTYSAQDVQFINAAFATAGFSLNEADFPPNSGTTVALDFSGPINLIFNTPITDFSGYFTYTEPVTITAFTSSGGPVLATVSSACGANYGSSGSGCAPNERITLSVPASASFLTLAGNFLGQSFTVDDVNFTTGGGSGGGGSVGVAPEIDTSTAMSALTFLLGSLAVLRGGRGGAKRPPNN